MRKITIAAAVLAIALGAGTASAYTVVGSKHDLSVTLGTGEVCLSCHAPHNGPNATAGPLWNHALSGGAGFTRDGSALTLYGNSLLCMGCHDGVTAVGNFNIVNPTVKAGWTAAGKGALAIQDLPGASATNNLSADLTATHPVGMVYPVLSGSDSTSFHAAASGKIGSKLRLEHGATAGTSDTVGCSTCHTPHDNTIWPFLRLSNANSALCTTCHIH